MEISVFYLFHNYKKRKLALVNSFLETLKQLGPTRLAIMGGILFALLTFFIFVSLRVSAPNYSLLYSDLATSDSTAIAAKLEENQIKYTVSNDGSRVTVQDTEVGRSRMLLAEAGLPNGGSLGYELFDQKSGFGTTNDIINLNKVRALEGELSRTISALDPVRSARVHIVFPERQLFSRQSRVATASVALGMRPGAQLSNDQILAIQSLVASAVPDLKPSKVSLIDQSGKLLARGDESSEDQASVKADEARIKYEQRLTRAVEDLVGRTVGYGNVRATVSADLNFDRVSTNEELFDPETQVARSVQTIEENNTERDANEKNVSIENNLPAAGNDLFFDEAPSLESNRLEETTNYEISRTTRSMVRESGEVKRLSVAVLVDGKYIKDAEGNETYEAEIITLAIMIILVLLLVIQPMVGKLLATEDEKKSAEDELEAELLTSGKAKPALEGPNADGFEPSQLMDEAGDDEMIDMQSIQGKVKASSVKKIEDIVENYPSETVSVIRNWMSEE